MRTAIIVINKNDPGIVQTVSALSQLRQVLADEAEIVVVDASEGRFDELRNRFPKVPLDPVRTDPRPTLDTSSAQRRRRADHTGHRGVH